LILVSGALVLIAALYGAIDQRLYEGAILRTLGGTRRLILGGLVVEFVFLGVAAGFMAAFGGEITALGLQKFAFRMPLQLHPWVWLVGPVSGALLITGLGFVACRKVVRVAPMVVLRELS
jgi:putative ABC transport system permease protein